ncbi:MAG: glycosyltransferase family 4 protein [Methanosarcinales archaeon]
METLRIGMFTWESLHSVQVGGIAPHVSELSEALAKKGHEVHIFTRIGDRSSYNEINGVYYQRCSHDQSGNIINQMDRMCDAMVERFKHVQNLFGEFDILHGHDWHPVNALNTLKARYGKNYVLTYHSTEWGRNGNTHGSWWEAKEISHREWSGGYESKEVIVTSQNLKNEIQSLYSIPDYKINIIPNGIFPNKIKKNVDPGEIKKRYSLHPFAPVVLFIGRMRYQKGPDLLVEAIPSVLKENWGVKFVFIGEGDMRPYCEHRAWQLNVRDQCRFLGYAHTEVALDWMNACEVVCVPSRNEPFGIVVLEAWDACKPVVGTGAVQLINNFSNGVRGYYSPESIAWCINYVMGDLEESKKMGLNGKKLVDTKYNWHNIANNTIEVYKKI